MAWKQWFQIHPETIFNQTSPTVISRNPNQVDVFKIGLDNAVWTTFWNPDNGWNAWFQIHPETVFDHEIGHITAISRNPNQIDLFTTGFDNRVWTTFWNPANGWNPWFQIHPETVFNQSTPVTVISRNPDQLDLFKIGFDGAVWTTFWNPVNGWNAWFQIHPETVFDVNGTVSAVSRNPDQLDLFVTGFNGAVWTTFWNPANGWNGWFQIHPETVFNQQAPIEVISRNPEQLDLFKIGFDGAVWTTFWNPVNGWNAWFQVHPETIFDVKGIVTALSRIPDQIDLFTTGFDGAVWSTFWNPSSNWNRWFQIHPDIVFNQETSVSVISRNPEQIDLFRIGFKNVLWSNWWEEDHLIISPWAVLLVKFKDDESPLPDLSVYQDLLTSSGSGKMNMVDYFRDMSHGQLDLSPSQLFGWYTLDQNRADYIGNAAPADGKITRSGLLDAAKNKANAAGVPLNNYSGVLVSVLGVADLCGFTGGRAAICDSNSLQPSLLGQEMGHGYGLDHSRLQGSDDDYQDQWDIMSTANAFESSNDEFTDVGPGMNAWNMRSRGWLNESRVWKNSNSDYSITLNLSPLHRIDLSNYLAAEIGEYLVEFRVKELWDEAIPRACILVHRFENNHSYLMPAVTGSQDIITGDKFISPDGKVEVEPISIDALNSVAIIKLSLKS